MLDKKAENAVQNAFLKLSVPIILLDESGLIYIPEEEEGSYITLPEDLPEEEIVEDDGRVFMRIDGSPMLLAATGAATDKNLIEMMGFAASILSGTLQSPRPGRDEAYRRAIREESTTAELEALAHEHKIELDHERCLLLFHCVNVDADAVQRMLVSILPRQTGDMIIEMDRHTIALIKCLDEQFTFEDLEQLANAVDNTLVSETTYQVTIGLGEPKRLFAQLGESFREARRAVEVGKMYRSEARVFVYRRLLLERFLAEVSRETGMRFHQMMFNRRTARLFNEEMIHTIEKFFDNNLNLSETARQLYIHRNTLVYRLDKVQRATGLDLRAFDDAVTFKMTMLLSKSGIDKPRTVL